MPTVNPFSSLPAVSFVNTDVAALQAAVISGFQAAWLADTGETLNLTLADRRANFLYSLVAYLIQERQLIDQSAKMNLLATSQGAFLDQIGIFFGPLGVRLPATGAVTEVEFTLTTSNSTAGSLIPAGTIVQSASTQLLFTTDEDLTIPANVLSGTVSATGQTTILGNGLLPGDLSTIIGWSGSFAVTASSTEATVGANDIESDDAFRLRLFNLTDSFSPAGPSGRYESYTYAVSPAIADVAVRGPQDGLPYGCVQVSLLCQDGAMPNSALLTDVYNALNGEFIRDLGAYLTVVAPSGVPYSVSVNYWIDQSQSANVVVIENNIQNAFNGWIAGNSAAQGGSINPATLSAAIMGAGASYCQVVQPSTRIQLAKDQVGVVVNDPICVPGTPVLEQDSQG